MPQDKRTYDPICYDVAELFALDETPPLTGEEKSDLAAHIQQAIEDWLAARAQKSL